MKKISLIATEAATQQSIKACFKNSTEFRLTRSYQTAEEAIKDLSTHPPDGLLIEERLADMDGVETVRRIKALLPLLPTLVFTPKAELGGVLPAFRAGARGFFILPIAPPSMHRTLEHVLAGGSGCSDEVQTMMVRPFLQIDANLLTPKEVTIMEYLVAKKQDKDIARETNRSTGTIHCMVSHILVKLKVHRRQDAVIAYFGLGNSQPFPGAPSAPGRR